MRFDFPGLANLSDLPFDTLIDTRSPAEFAEDHVPGAISLPVLSDAERAQVGTIYVQDSPFNARKIGGALVAKNIARHLEGPLADKDGAWKPLVYCWRGGQRSGAFGIWLREVGWRAQALKGGYQTYRRAVVSQLYDTPLNLKVVLLDGYTGTAKTELLHRVAELGGQVLDLEGLANHRGSLLGIRPGGQPSQKMFETKLSQQFTGLDPTRPVLVEAESSKVGDILVPPSLWKQMRGAPRLMVAAEVTARVAYLCEAYADLFSDLPLFTEKLRKMVPFQGYARVNAWCDLAKDGAFQPLVQELVEHHYDGRYRKSQDGHTAPVETFEIDLNQEGLDRAAHRICEALNRFDPG